MKPDRAQQQIQALRSWRAPRAYPSQNALPLSLLAAGRPATFGALTLLQIDCRRYQQELKRGVNEVFRLGRTYALEIPHNHSGPWTDYLVEAN